jgi:hypothetical protein
MAELVATEAVIWIIIDALTVPIVAIVVQPQRMSDDE